MSRLTGTLAVPLILLSALTESSLVWASSVSSHSRPIGFQSWIGNSSNLAANLNPSTPDDWLGGAGNWSNAADWSGGEPGNGNDVIINSGNDAVTLDTNANINSLTLGGTSGHSTLSDSLGRGYEIQIAGALTINQSGTLTFTEDVIVANGNSTNAGTINLSNASGLSFNGNFSNSGTIELNGFAARPGIGIAGTLTNSGQIVDNFDSAFLDVGGTLSNSGGLFIYSLTTGALTNTASGSIDTQFLTVNGNLTNAGMMFGYERGSQFSITGTLTNSGRFDTSYATATLGGLNNSGEFLVGGIATVNGNASNSGGISEGYIGPSGGQELVVNGTFTNVPSGNVQLTGPYIGGMSATSIVNQGTIQMGGDAPLSAGTLTNSGTISTGVGGGGSTISVSGTLTNNAGGTLSLGGMSDVANVAYVNNAGSISIANGATFNITGGSHAVANAFPGFLNSGSVLISQGGTLSSPLTYTQITGQTTVDGTLRINGNGVANFAGGAVYGNGGTIQGNVISNAAFNMGDLPMTVGTMAINGNYTQGANGSLAFDIASLTSYDQLNVSGHASLNGTLYVDLLNGYTPQIGNMFDIMNYAGKSGTFSMTIGLPINNNEHFVLEYNPTNLTLDVVAGPDELATSGRANGNVYYYEPYVSDVTQGANLADLSRAPSSSVPEPGSIVLLASGILGIAGLRRKFLP